jgi:putative transcriptional regulator
MKNRLEDLRKKRGISQEQLALVLGVSRQTVSSLENGRLPLVASGFKDRAFLWAACRADLYR